MGCLLPQVGRCDRGEGCVGDGGAFVLLPRQWRVAYLRVRRLVLLLRQRGDQVRWKSRGSQYLMRGLALPGLELRMCCGWQSLGMLRLWRERRLQCPLARRSRALREGPLCSSSSRSEGRRSGWRDRSSHRHHGSMSCRQRWFLMIPCQSW